MWQSRIQIYRCWRCERCAVAQQVTGTFAIVSAGVFVLCLMPGTRCLFCVAKLFLCFADPKICTCLIAGWQGKGQTAVKRVQCGGIIFLPVGNDAHHKYCCRSVVG